MKEKSERAAWLEQAMARHEESLLRMCFAYLGDAALAEDAVQETFVKAYRALPDFRGEAQEKTWLTRIAINTCKDVRRGAWFRHVDRRAAVDALEISAPCAEYDDTLARAVMGLKRKYREAVLLCYYQGLNGQEAAEALGVTQAAVHNRLQKARAILRKELEAWYDGE